MMIRHFFRHVTTSVKSLFRNGWLTLAGLTSVGFALFTLAALSMTVLTADKLVNEAVNNLSISVFLTDGSQDFQETLTKDGKTSQNPDYHKVYDQIKALEGVDKITFKSKDDYLKESGLELMEGDSNPLQDAYLVSVKEANQMTLLADEIEGISGVAKTSFGQLETERLQVVTANVRLWGSVVILVFVLVAIFLIANTIRLTIFARQSEIEIMRLVGATNAYIRGPFFFEGAWIGLLGSLVPAALIYLGYHWVYQSWNPGLVRDGLSLYEVNHLALPVIVAMLVLGILVGSLGSVLSMKRFLKI